MRDKNHGFTLSFLSSERKIIALFRLSRLRLGRAHEWRIMQESEYTCWRSPESESPSLQQAYRTLAAWKCTVN